MGHRVIGVDVNPVKVEMIESGRSPIIEAQMSEMVAEARSACRLHATNDAVSAIHESEISFVCVGTPGLRSGKLDLSHVEHAAHEIGTGIKTKSKPHTIVLRSTVLPGTTEALFIPTVEQASGKQCGQDFKICYNPEFMRESSAVADFFNPPHTILGAHSPEDLTLLRDLYNSLPGPVFQASISVAELVKYVSNAFHALKAGFANEVGTLCKQFGVDTQAVTRIFTSDTRLNISPAYLSPGLAFGGSCLPKDLRALTHRAKELDLQLPLLESVLPSNVEHLNRAAEAVLRTGKKRIAVLGLSFKAGTDDLRESPQVQLVKRLLGEGCQISIWDRDVSLGQIAGSNRQYIEGVIPHIGSLLSSNIEEVVASGEVVIIATKVLDIERLTNCLRSHQFVFDLVNLDPDDRPRGCAHYEGICW